MRIDKGPQASIVVHIQMTYIPEKYSWLAASSSYLFLNPFKYWSRHVDPDGISRVKFAAQALEAVSSLKLYVGSASAASPDRDDK